MSKLILAVFGARVTVLYKNGAKMRMRARSFDVRTGNSGLIKAKWRRPVLSWSREPIWLNVDAVDAVWQGKA